MVRVRRQLEDSQRERVNLPPLSLLLSCQAFNGLDKAHPHWQGSGAQSALLSLRIQMLISSRNILRDGLRIFRHTVVPRVDTRY